MSIISVYNNKKIWIRINKMIIMMNDNIKKNYDEESGLVEFIEWEWYQWKRMNDITMEWN